MSSTRISEVHDMDSAMSFIADCVAWNEQEVQKIMTDAVDLYRGTFVDGEQDVASFTDCLIEVLKNIYL